MSEQMGSAVEVITGDCVDALDQVEDGSVDLVYIDPPFFTQKVHKSTTRNGEKDFSFNDVWKSHAEYCGFLFDRVLKAYGKLNETGSLFFHCDKAASHIARVILDDIFGPKGFQSEIIWHYRRWSNAKRGLLPAHQTIFFYAKSKNFKFNQKFQAYSPTTNVDQIMQKRTRDSRNKSVYVRDGAGQIVGNGAKKGVPMSDVWEIPYLNPKAKERVGYPTQKPILLLQRIVELVTDEGDVVLDPFCGSGSMLVAAELLGRKSIGIDISKDATELAKKRLDRPVSTRSVSLTCGRESFEHHSAFAAGHLGSLDYTPVQRNKGIDGILKRQIGGRSVLLRVQRENETLNEAASKLIAASKNKGECRLVLISTSQGFLDEPMVERVDVIPSLSYKLSQIESR